MKWCGQVVLSLRKYVQNHIWSFANSWYAVAKRVQHNFYGHLALFWSPLLRHVLFCYTDKIIHTYIHTYYYVNLIHNICGKGCCKIYSNFIFHLNSPKYVCIIYHAVLKSLLEFFYYYFYLKKDFSDVAFQNRV